MSIGLQPGAPADVVELDPQHPALIAREDDAWLDSWVFAARNGAVRSVWRGGASWYGMAATCSATPLQRALPTPFAACLPRTERGRHPYQIPA